jgi:hypothetical protein
MYLFKLCHAENERFGRNSLSKRETVSNRTDLKTNLKNLSKNSALSKSENLSNPKTQKPKFQKILKYLGSVAPRISLKPPKLSN